MNVFTPTRPEIQGRSWAIVSANPLSTLAGARMILTGGNAVDAAVAVAAAVGIVEPFDSSLLGGESCILYWNNHKKQLLAVQGTGYAPALASLENYTKLGGIPFYGPRSVIVPGSFDGWALLLADFGTLRLTEVLKPAIELAERGFLVSAKLHASMTQFHKELLRLPTSSRIYLKEEKPYAKNELLFQRDYAETLRAISSFDGAGRQRNIAIQAARDWVYRGELASRLCRFMELEGGLIGADDLAAYKAEYVSPISVTYRDREVVTVPPPSQGIALLEALNILEGYDLSRYGHSSPETLHLMVEAMKLGYADREYYVADPTFFKVPVDMLLSKDYAVTQRQRIQTNKTLVWPFAFSPGGSSTTTLAAADEAGNLLVATTSLGQLGVVASDTGVVLNNRMRMFHEDPGHPNCVAPGKRVRITLNPVMVFEQGRPSFAVASPGADVQSQAQLQAIVGMVDFSMNPQVAAEIPRWISTEFPNTSIPHGIGRKLQIEPGFSQDVGAALREKGHDLEIGTGPGMLAIIQGSLARGWIAGADPRGETYALAW